MEWALRRQGITEDFGEGSYISIYKRPITSVRISGGWIATFEVKLGLNQGLVLEEKSLQKRSG